MQSVLDRKETRALQKDRLDVWPGKTAIQYGIVGNTLVKEHQEAKQDGQDGDHQRDKS